MSQQKYRNRRKGRHMNNKQKESYSPPMLVKHEILRDLTAQCDALIQVDRLPVGMFLGQNPSVTDSPRNKPGPGGIAYSSILDQLR